MHEARRTARRSCSSGSVSATRGNDLPAALSGGEQQRVAVCASLAHRPGLLLVDEPAGELDARVRRDGLRAARGARSRGRRDAALVVSHDRDASGDRRPDRPRARRTRRRGGRGRKGAGAGSRRLPGRLDPASWRAGSRRRHGRARGEDRPPAAPRRGCQRWPKRPVAGSGNGRADRRAARSREGVREAARARGFRPHREAGIADRPRRPVGNGEDDRSPPPRRSRPSHGGRGRRRGDGADRAVPAPRSQTCGGRRSRSSPRSRGSSPT